MMTSFTWNGMLTTFDLASNTQRSLQVECHPGWRNGALAEYNAKKGIHTSAWSPLGGQVIMPPSQFNGYSPITAKSFFGG